MMNTHWACTAVHRGVGIKTGDHNVEWRCAVADKHDPHGGPRDCYTCKIAYKAPPKRRQYAPGFHYSCELMPWEHDPPARQGALGGHREGCPVKDGHEGGAGMKCYTCRMRYLGREGAQPFLGSMNDHPHYDCPLTPTEHAPMKRNGRGHRPGCAVAEGHDFGKARECKACKLLRDDVGKMRTSKLMLQFGITPAEYDEMLVKQGGVCAICGKVNVGGKRLAVDHDHVTGNVRALLCGRCNTAIGALSDSADLIRKAAEYVEGHAE